MITCNICNMPFETSPDSIVLCKHKNGAVHLGCCLDRCSQNRAICIHSMAVYQKLPPR
jgi:hypothetical protein